MEISNTILYAIILFSWGTSWLAIKFQLGDVHPQFSVAYRFLLSGLILLIYCRFAKLPMKFSRAQHLWIGVQAIFLFGTNYVLIYYSSQFIPSGLESIVFSTITFMNIINSRLLLKERVSSIVVVATIIGFSGIILVFGKSLHDLTGSKEILIGAGLGLIAAYSASLGNIIASRNHKAGIPTIQSTAVGMAYGGAITFMISLLMGIRPTISLSMPYLSSLLFLSVFASILAFLSYLTLLGKIGASRASYCVLVFPLIAVTLSIFFESYRPDLNDAAGVALVLMGSYLIMFKSGLKKA